MSFYKYIYLYLYTTINISLYIYLYIYTNMADIYISHHRLIYKYIYTQIYIYIFIYQPRVVVRHISFIRLVQLICLPSYKNVSNTFNLIKPQFPHQ